MTTMTNPELEPLPDGVLKTLRKASTSTIATQLYKRGSDSRNCSVSSLGGLRDGHVVSRLPFPTYASQVTITTRAAHQRPIKEREMNGETAR
jgi:hypothetical protein